jgi:pimeloyl-ACP methyl ester carboxylesterase
MAPISRRLPLATGLTYHLLEWGAEADHTVVLLHGFLDLAWGWVPVVEAGLAGRFHVIAPDFRGHGDSDRVGDGGYYYFPDYLADLHDLLAQLGHTRVSLVGHSMGGSVAAYYAGAFPGRIHRLAILEGMGPPEQPPIGPERVVAWLAAWRRARQGRGHSYATVDEAAARLRAHDPLLDEAQARTLAEHGTRCDPDGRLRFKHDPLHLTPGPFGYQTEVGERFWRNITAPVLLVEGGASTFRLPPDEAARRERAIPNLRRATLDGAGHMMQRHRPTQLAQLLREFLDE